MNQRCGIRRAICWLAAVVSIAVPAGSAAAAEIVVQWAPPAGRHLAAASAVPLQGPIADVPPAGAPPTASTITGIIAPPGAHFHVHAPGAYALQIAVDDGTVLRGVNLNWYSPEPPDPTAGPLTPDDQRQIFAIARASLDPNGFFNHADILALRGSDERAVALVQLLRDKTFATDAGGEIIWRVELWYLKNENGGWIKLPQVSKMILRQRLSGRAAFAAAVSHVLWVPALGDVEVGPDVSKVQIILPPNAGVGGASRMPTTASTRPSAAPPTLPTSPQ